MNRIESGFQKAINIPLAGLLALSMGAAACGGNTTETTPPPTSPTTITTEVPTTTLPTTITTEATTTTTTEAYSNLPDYITKPTGEYQARDEAHGPLPYPVPLGIVISEENLPPYVEAILTGRLINTYTEVITDFQGQPAEVVFVDIVLGEYTNGNPFIVKFMLGRSIDNITETRSLNNFFGILEGEAGRISDYEEKLKTLADRYSQIRLVVLTNIPDDIQKACLDPETFNSSRTGCEWFLEGLEQLNSNKKILELLQSGGIEPGYGLTENEFGSLVTEIHTFPPHN